MEVRTSVKAAEFQRRYGRAMDADLLTVNQPSDRIKGLNLLKQAVNGPMGPIEIVKKRPQIRIPAKRGPNKTEMGWLGELQKRLMIAAQPEGFEIRFEPFTLILPSGCRYTPDFVIFDLKLRGLPMEIWEVKGGHIHNSASIRAFKEAKSAFPFWKFCFAQKRGKEWVTT